MPYYARSAYYPLPGAPQAAGAAPPLQQLQQQQYAAQAAPQVDQVYLRQQQAQAQAQQLAYQQQQQQQLQQQQYIEQQNRQLAQQQYYQQQQQYAAQLQLQEQQYARQQQQQQALQQQQLQQQASRQQQPQQRSGYQAAPAVCQQQQTPLYKSSEYVQAGGVYSTGGAFNQPSLRRVPSRADVNTAIENQEAPFQPFGQGLTAEQQRTSQYNPYATYGQTVPQSPSIRPQRASQREPSEYAFDALNPVYRQPQQQYAQDAAARDLPTAREQPSASNVWLGARTLNVPTTVVLDANNNNNNAAPAPLPPRSPARGYGSQQQPQQRGYGSGSGAQAESAYIGIPNDLHYAQNNQQRAYNGYGQESRPVYASSSRTNQQQQLPAASPAKLKPAAARELYAALSSENVRTALERDAPVLQQVLAAQQLQQLQQQSAPAYSTYNGQRVQGRAFVVPAEQKYSEYTLDDLNGLRSVIDR